jgi:hypothetical protein
MLRGNTFANEFMFLVMNAARKIQAHCSMQPG